MDNLHNVHALDPRRDQSAPRPPDACSANSSTTSTASPRARATAPRAQGETLASARRSEELAPRARSSLLRPLPVEDGRERPTCG